MRLGPIISSTQVFIFEAITGVTVYTGAAGTIVIGRLGILDRIVGGLGTWISAASRLRGLKIGPYKDLTKILSGTLEQANHLNQAKAFPKIPTDEGVSIALEGSAGVNDTLHRAFHAATEAYFREFRSGGSKYGLNPTNVGYDQAVRTGLSNAGLLPDEIDALAQLAKASREYWKYFDGPGGLLPDVPNRIASFPGRTN